MDFKFWGKVRTTDNLKCVDRIILGLSEFFGTFALLLIGCLSCVSPGQKGATDDSLKISFAFGMAILIAIQSFAHISGAHINPIISLAAVMRGGLPLVELPIYLVAQFLGATGGYGMLVLIFPKGMLVQGNTCSHNPGLADDARIFGIEFWLSFFLVAVVCSIWDYRNANNTDGISVKFGLTVAGLAAAGFYFSGAHMNPARTFGPALINNTWKRIWPYFVGPILGGFIAVVLYNIFFSGEDTSGQKGSTVFQE